ncbi:CRM-domain containing factor CFM3, chloroplastic/mitochondrial-like [Impatiens glandulifera]|uniref:CRM-domain containing factor CFM3, chloroplastic/mitochondrial-like n=1 Tax=Impatiens glandulifera TaxID=253017 RepID=UPI001FB09E1C|nr:CRM-domain containing factor CFM3, chloroplastic/mitochondrial-like [Impatiens glandulifera]
MAVSTAKFTEFPFRATIPLAYQPSTSLHPRFFFYSYPRRTFSLFKSFSSLRSTTESSRVSRNPGTRKNSYLLDDEQRNISKHLNHGQKKSRSSSSPPPQWINNRTSSQNTQMDSDIKRGEERTESRYFDGKSGSTSIERIVLRLRNLGLGSDDEEEEEEEENEENINENMEMSMTGEEQLGDLLRRDWVRPDNTLSEEEENESWLPWERMGKSGEGADENDRKGTRRNTLKPPTLAELTIEDEELRRLRTQGMTLKERINVAKAGVTAAVLEKIHGQWRRSELVRLKFHEILAHDMKTAHEIVERRTGGLVIWKSGSVMVVYRGSNYAGPSQIQRSTEVESDNLETNTVLNPEKAKVVALSSRLETITEEEIECSSLLDGLGPRFEDWWGTGILPVDADMLPQTIKGYKTPYRLLPTGMRPRLTNSEMTNLRKHARSLPCHFALGRNRNHQGLAAAILKLWEKSLVVKIAVKRGIQNTNNKLMADEIKNLTGGVLLLRNKFYIVIYRGKDFVPTSVAAVLAERTEMTKQVQDVEEKVRIKATEAALLPVDGQGQAGSLAEFYEAQAKWGREITDEDREKLIEEAAKAKSSKAVKKVEHKITIAQLKLLKAEKILAKLEASMIPVGPSDDQETISEEERSMFRKVGLKMKPYLPLGIRGVFDGVIENMHLHWKHRELVKLISKQKNLAFVEETARLLEYESGGVLVTIERVPKGHALIYYRGKNYRRPISLRPRNLLTKAKALKRSVAMQRYEALTQHMSELEKTIEQMKHEIGDNKDEVDGSTINAENDELANLDSVENENEASWSNSDNDDDNDEDENDLWDYDETTSSDLDNDRH